MARNGTDFGIRVSGHGERWFTAPVNVPSGLYFPGFDADDANPDMGDSAIVETIGLGGCAMAASPAAARFVGAGGMAEALQVTAEMRDICVGEHPHFRIPMLDEQGVTGRHRSAAGDRDRPDATHQHWHRRTSSGYRPDRRRHRARSIRVFRTRPGGVLRVSSLMIRTGTASSSRRER